MAEYTRQALSQHGSVKLAFQLAKEHLRGQPSSEHKGSQGLKPAQALLERLSRLEAENVRLKAENDRLLEQFVV